jgi:hypothetical protein
VTEGGTSGQGGAGGEQDPFCSSGQGWCQFDENSGLNCEGVVGQTNVFSQMGRHAVIDIDMAQASRLTITVRICNPASYVLALGDSFTNDGGGGDAGQFSNDAELEIHDAALLSWANDRNPSDEQSLGVVLDYVPAEGCVTRTWIVGDSTLITDGLEINSPYFLRLAPDEDLEGEPDSWWFLGVNRSIWRQDRVGEGVQWVRMCFESTLG